MKCSISWEVYVAEQSVRHGTSGSMNTENGVPLLRTTCANFFLILLSHMVSLADCLLQHL